MKDERLVFRGKQLNTAPQKALMVVILLGPKSMLSKINIGE